MLLGEPRNLRIRGMETRLIKGHQIVHAENTTLMIRENHGIVEKSQTKSLSHTYIVNCIKL